MESGVVPPPARRSAPKSLVGAKDARRQPEPGATPSSSAAPRTGQEEAPTLREKRLEEMLSAEAAENHRLQAALREQTVKFERSMQQQSQLEEDVVAKDSRIKLLSDELRIMKQKKHSTDSELAQSTADYMNSQAKWLEQVDQLNDEIQLLRAKFNESKLVATELEKEAAELRAREKRRDAEERKKGAKATKPDYNIQVAADSLEKHQNELLIKELRSRHNQIQAEITEIKAVNERLREDNENFQYLLVERTVSGELTAPAPDAGRASDADAAGGQTLADEEVFDFDPQGATAEPGKQADIGTPSLADEGNDGVSSSMTPTSEVSEAGEEKNAKFLQKTINKQQFELQSLRNHNRALKLSLERLVDRLLDNKTFSRAVEEAVSTSVVQKFKQRLASSTMELDRQLGGGLSGSNGGSTNLSQVPASAWSNMIFNAQYSGTPNRRVLSLGVDSEFKAPPSPLVSYNPRDGARAISSSGSIEAVRPLGRVRDAPSRKSSVSASSVHSSDSPPSSIHVAKRTDGQCGLRKLRLKE